MPRSRFVAPLIRGYAGRRKQGRERERSQAIAGIELEDVNFGWWALASAFAFVPCAVLALVSDAVLGRMAGWSSPSVLGMFLLLGPWALATWFLIRAVATSGAGRVGLLDDIGVVGALVLVGFYATLVV